jgi:hypothetical protein
MILYSVTISLDKAIFEDWLNWMQSVHIPAVMNTGYFTAYHLHRLIEPPAEGDSVTLNIQYECESLEKYLNYREKEATALQEEHTQRYKDKFVAFRTLLERIQ